MGLHQWPSEKKDQNSRAFARPVPSHVPIPPQTAAKGPAFSSAADESAGETDSPLEEGGFELVVPL